MRTIDSIQKLCLSWSRLIPSYDSLAGLTCTEDTGAQKGHLLAPAAKHGIAIVFPDTSPRGAGIDGEDEDWDFGTGAGFYLNANKDKYAEFYNMEEFVTKELRQAIEAELPVVSRSICFHP